VQNSCIVPIGRACMICEASWRANRQLRGLFDAGVDSVGLWLFPAENHADVMRRIAQDVR
jgi:hypothetical protein